jgi:hypothetical protein
MTLHLASLYKIFNDRKRNGDLFLNTGDCLIEVTACTGLTVHVVFVTLFSDHIYTFLVHLAKGHVSFCHHLASVVRRKLSHLNLLL